MASPDSTPSPVRRTRADAGLAATPLLAVVDAHGNDTVAFLQNQLPLDIAALAAGRGGYTAYLDQKGRVTHDLVLVRLDDRVRMLVRPDLAASLVGKLEQYRIRERVEFTRREDLAVLELHGPGVPERLLALTGERVPTEAFHAATVRAGAGNALWVTDPWTGDVGGHLVVETAAAKAWVTALETAAPAPARLGEAELEVLRVEGGRPRPGVDLDQRTLLLELDMPDMVAHDKGCYLGQETVARVYARGRVQRLWRGLLLEGTHVPAPGDLLQHAGGPVGEIRAAVFSPSLEAPVALAFVRRQACEPGTVVHVETPAGLTAARVTMPPIYRVPGPAEAAESAYREGLSAFEAGNYEDALARFERALLMNPHHVDACESMGVTQERMGRLDDAIETMTVLTDMEPEHVMAWTNLSRYRAQQGNIEEAERLKGHVTFLVWKREAGAKAAEREAEAAQAAAAEQREQRVELFRQVLELDAEDVVANFGLGKTLLDLERFEEAVPHLEKAVEVKRDYSMAYNLLGTALARLARYEEAAAAFRRGVEAADRNGDFIPKREMTRKLEELPSGS